MNKKSKSVVFVLLVVAIIMLMGLSYAWYQLTLNGNNPITITTGTLEVSYSESDGVINLTNAEPMSDEEGMSTNPYTLTITNTGNLASSYTIYADDTSISSEATRIPSEYVKYNIECDGISEQGTFDELEIDSNNTSTVSRILKTGSIDALDSLTCNLRIWISEDAPNSVMNNELGIKIRIVNTQPLE